MILKALRQKKKRAKVLLSLDGRRSSYTVEDHMAFTFGVSKSFIYCLLDRYNRRGVDSVKKKPSTTPRPAYKMSEEIKNRIVELMQTPLPRGRQKWSAEALADKIEEEGLAEKLSFQTVYRFLDKKGIKL